MNTTTHEVTDDNRIAFIKKIAGDHTGRRRILEGLEKDDLNFFVTNELHVNGEMEKFLEEKPEQRVETLPQIKLLIGAKAIIYEEITKAEAKLQEHDASITTDIKNAIGVKIAEARTAYETTTKNAVSVIKAAQNALTEEVKTIDVHLTKMEEEAVENFTTAKKAGDSLVSSTPKALKKHADVIPKDLADVTQVKLDELKSALKGTDTVAIKNATQNLEIEIGKIDGVVALAASKNRSREQRILLQVMVAEIGVLVEAPESVGSNLKETVKKHYGKSTAADKVVLYGIIMKDIDPGAQDYIDLLVLTSVFSPLFEVTPAVPTDPISREIKICVDLLELQYQKIVFPVLTSMSAEDARAMFKEKILTSAAENIAVLSKEDVDDIKEQLDPLYREVLEDLRQLLSM